MSPTAEDVLTVAEAAEVARRSVRTIRRAYRAGSLRAYRDGNGRGVRIRFGDLREWMMAKSASALSIDADQPISGVRHRKRFGGRPESSDNMRLLKAAQQRRNGSAHR